MSHPRREPAAAAVKIPDGHDLSRRHLLLLGGAAALAGCTTRPGLPTPSTTASAPSSASSSVLSSSEATSTSQTSGTSSSTGTRPAWTPDPNDVSPQVKLAAAQYIETTVSQPAVEVVFAQYGGILTDSASVLVVTQPRPAATDPATGSTYDVRLVRSGSTWHVTQVQPSAPGPAAATLSAAARQVLAQPRMELPPAGRADIASGQVHDSVLEAMLTLSQAYRIGVSVVRSGHPTDVFGTSRLSDHPLGRAFDTWRIDEQSVVSASTPPTLVTAYMQAAARAGSYNIGGPYLLHGATYFSDDTHHDHVHAGFRS